MLTLSISYGAMRLSPTPFGILIFPRSRGPLVPGRERRQVLTRREMSSLSTCALARIAAGSNAAASAARAASR